MKLHKAIAIGLIVLLTGAGAVWADEATPHSEGNVTVGYRALSIDGDAGRASEYLYPHSSVAAAAEVRGWEGVKHFILKADYLNENDYRAEAHLDHGGLMRLNLRAERIFHNLEHIPYAPGLAESRSPASLPGNPRADFADSDPSADYGLRVDISEAQLRAKPADYPAHVNLNYWRFEKKGQKQLRFVEENCAGACHMQSRTRDLDRVVEEFKGGVDGHFGPVDVAFEQVYREFRDHESTPVDDFDRHHLRDSFARAPGSPANPRPYQHDEDPDSRYVASTIKAHTSLSGGVVGAATFTIGERENRSELSDVQSVESETDFYKATGDLTLIPSPRWTLNFRYRLLDMDNDNSNQLVVPDYQDDPANDTVKTISSVRENVDVRRANYAATVNYRPVKGWSLKGEYQREEIHRGNTGGAIAFSGFSGVNDVVWELPQDEVLNRYRLGFAARLLEKSKLKLRGWYQVRTSDDPAYGNSAEDSHQVFFGAMLNPSNTWGLNASLGALEETNNDHQVVQFNGGDELPVDLDRQREQQNLALGLWMNPAAGVSAGFNYGYLRTRILQDLLFGSSPGADLETGDSIKDENLDYTQRVHTLSANLGWQLTEQLRGTLEGHHIRSQGRYNPEFSRTGIAFDADSEGLEELSEVDIRQNGLRLGLAWSPDSAWTYAADLSYDDYEERNRSAFDGTVKTCMVSVSRSW